ncbi:WD_REPEATS_REGION domain-containing protein, partial [Linnemannia elongata]
MSSSPPQSNSPPSPPSLVSSERLEISIEGQYVISQLEHITSLGRVSSKRKCVSIPFNEEPQVKKTVPTSTASSPLTTLVRTEELSQSAAPGRNALPVLLKLQSPILAKVQEIPKLEYDLHILRSMRITDYKQAVYIDPMAKLSLQDTDDNLFSLMDKVRNFIAGDTQVMLVLGDSGAGKSTFNRHLEHQLWQEYKPGGRIPLFINLPSLERPKRNLVAEQLRTHNFLEDQIRELKLYRQFTLICDGYDESQLASNLHTTNLLNRSGQWDVKLLATCRSQYLGPDYRGRFVPLAVNQYNRAADDLFTEAVIAPFSKGQIEDYVERYVALEPRTWVKKDYMDKLEIWSKNPFLLTLCLEALPDFVRGKSDLSRIRVTRVQLYDNFVRHWLE